MKKQKTTTTTNNTHCIGYFYNGIIKSGYIIPGYTTTSNLKKYFDEYVSKYGNSVIFKYVLTDTNCIDKFYEKIKLTNINDNIYKCFTGHTNKILTEVCGIKHINTYKLNQDDIQEIKNNDTSSDITLTSEDDDKQVIEIKSVKNKTKSKK